MTAELLVLQFVEDGKLTVEDAVQLLESLAQDEPVEQDWSKKNVCAGGSTPTHRFLSRR